MKKVELLVKPYLIGKLPDILNNFPTGCFAETVKHGSTSICRSEFDALVKVSAVVNDNQVEEFISAIVNAHESEKDRAKTKQLAVVEPVEHAFRIRTTPVRAISQILKGKKSLEGSPISL